MSARIYRFPFWLVSKLETQGEMTQLMEQEERRGRKETMGRIVKQSSIIHVSHAAGSIIGRIDGTSEIFAKLQVRFLTFITKTNPELQVRFLKNRNCTIWYDQLTWSVRTSQL
jgi:hypothetical protein